MSKVLVTGGTGFLGQHVVKKLKLLGRDVYALGRNEAIGSTLEAHGIHFIKASLSDLQSVKKACAGMDYVIHCAALSSPWGKYEDYYECNVVGTQNVIEGCVKKNVSRLIYVSTPSVYFNYDERLNVKEDDELPVALVNDYAKTKHIAEREVEKAFSMGLPSITIRPRGIFGEGDNAIIPRLIKANQKIGIPWINNGQTLLDITYVENVVDALLLCMTTGEENLGEKFNITNDNPVFLKDIMTALFNYLDMPLKKFKISYKTAFTLAHLMELIYSKTHTHKEPPLTRYSVSVLSKIQTLNIDKAKERLGYLPSVTVNDGIKKYAQWYIENELMGVKQK